MKASLALLLTAGTAFGAGPALQTAPSAVTLSPFAVVGAPVALRTSVLPAFSASLPLLESPLALTAQAPVLAAPSAPMTPRTAPVVAALPVLSALKVLPAAAIGDGWDGAGRHEEENEESYANAERKKREAEAVQYAHAEIPVVDYRRGAYEEESAKQFMEGVYEVDEKTRFTGRELLSFLITPSALPPDHVPDPARVDFNTLGKTSAQIRQTLEEKGMPYHPYERILTEAFRDGLVYRLVDSRSGTTYTGVPPLVRARFGLEPEVAAPAAVKTAPVATATPFSEALTKLAADAETLPKHEELFEFTAQAVDAAIKAGRLPADAVSKAFRARADALGYDVPSLSDAVITLSESAEGTPWEMRTAALLALLD